jgi:hypothetical protein
MEPSDELFSRVQIPMHRYLPDEEEYKEVFETVSLIDLQPHEICDYCQSIPFDLLGFHGKILMEELDRLFPGERPLQQVFSNLNKCFFCQKTAMIFQRFNREKCGNLTLSQLGKIDVDMLPVWQHSVEKDENGQHEGRLLRLGVQFWLWDFTPDGDNYTPIFLFQRFNEPSLKTADFCKDENDENWSIGSAKPYSGRIRPLLADSRIFRKWKDTCCMKHREHCDARFTGDHLDRLRLIDVEDMCIVEAPRGQDYVALSYVWGTAEMLKLQKGNFDHFQTLGSLKSASLPTTIADAAVVTQGLGEKYLWVDALCIVQDDEMDKSYFIPNMDSVYGCALVTIIALSGDGANAGLPGIRPGSRIQEEVPFTIGKTSIIASLDPPREKSFDSYLGQSRWDSRGWTFQEKIFSRRALVFTSEQVYWECQQGSWCEEAIWEIDATPHIFRKAFKSAQLLLPWSDQVSAESTYQTLVEQYSARKLSFETDALNAFAGILHAMERTWRQKYFWGLPCSFFSSALQWKTARGHKVARRVASAPYKTSEGATVSLEIPSWSWAGWNSGVSMANFDSRGMAIEVRFYSMMSSGKLEEIIEGEQPIRSEVDTLRRKWKRVNDAAVDMADLPSGVLDHPSRLTFLYFWSSSAKLSYHWLPDFMGNLRLIVQGLRFAWMQLPNLEPMIQKGTGDLIIPGGEIESTSSGEFVVIGRDMHTRVGGCGDMLMLILIERKGDIVYRQGLLSVAEEDWALIDCDWKLFVLS